MNDHRHAEAKEKASLIAVRLNIEQSYAEKRPRFRKRLFEYDCAEEASQSPEDEYRVGHFLVILDAALTSVEDRFTSLSRWLSVFSFLHERGKLIDACEQGHLKSQCHFYTSVMGDVDESDLEREVQRFKFIISKNKDLKNATDFLNYIFRNELQEIYPNLSIALRVLLTTPVTVATAERSFSRLKLIKKLPQINNV